MILLTTDSYEDSTRRANPNINTENANEIYEMKVNEVRIIKKITIISLSHFEYRNLFMERLLAI